MNAVKTGLHVSGWLDEQERSEYESLYAQLCQEYAAHTPTLLIQIERMASTMVRMRRLQKIEAAQFLKVRQVAYRFSQDKAAHQEQNALEAQQTAEIAQLAAMPDPQRLAALQRYQTSLDRQLSKIIGEIRILTASRATTSPAALSSHLEPSIDYTVSTIDED